MSPRKTATFAFASAVVLLLLCGVAAILAISRYSENAEWVNHTYEVKVAARKAESTLAEVARNRLGYITSGDTSYLQRYEDSKKDVTEDLAELRDLTADNPEQQDACNRLEFLVNQRLALLQVSMQARAGGQPDTDVQSSVSLKNTAVATDVAQLIDQMQKSEDVLLEQRKKSGSRLFGLTLWIFGAMLGTAVVLLWIHYRFLNDELGKREEAELGARRLSAHVLNLQDEERRRFSRELHDGLGQELAAAKMIAQSLSEDQPENKTLPELLGLLDQSIQETRTISYLLHPPLLDELGLASAANWYLDGFAERSGLRVTQDIEGEMGRLPRTVELVLFRVLQESLTNVHRHSKSPRAEIYLRTEGGNAVLRVRDYGVGIPAEKLQNFDSHGTHAGVGLTGMRERVREHGGRFEIRSDAKGTELRVSIPIAAARDAHAAVPQQATAD